MSGVVSVLEGAVGVVLALAVLIGFVWIVGRLAFAGRRRVLRRGTHPLRLLPWYLGGPPDATVEHPPGTGRDRPHRR